MVKSNAMGTNNSKLSERKTKIVMKNFKMPLYAMIAAMALFTACENDFEINNPTVTVDDAEINVGDAGQDGQGSQDGNGDPTNPDGNGDPGTPDGNGDPGDPNGDGDQGGDETPPAETGPRIVINEVNYSLEAVEIANLGTEAAEVGDYWLCLGPGTYRRVGSPTINTNGTSTLLQPGEFIVLSYTPLSGNPDGLGLYTSTDGNFVDPDELMDFVQYGAGGSSREDVAAAAGIWTLNDFVPLNAEGTSIIFDGEGNTSGDWSEAAPSLGSAN